MDTIQDIIDALNINANTDFTFENSPNNEFRIIHMALLKIQEKQTKKETRVYVVQPIMNTLTEDEEFDPTNQWFNEEKFITEAEKQGRVFTLESFQKAFNTEQNINTDNDYIYFKEVEVNE